MRYSWLGGAVALVCALLGRVEAFTANASVVLAAQRPDTARPKAAPQNALQLAQQVVARGDHGQRPFAVVDKQAALILVFQADGLLAGSSSVLLGRAPGDQSAPGVGQRTDNGSLRDSDRTTPAGRFRSEPGRNLAGEAIIWLDYDIALAIHRLRNGPSRASRVLQLASADSRGRRVSAGCVVVPEAFYDGVVERLLGRSRGMVYVMPENGAWQDNWPHLRPHKDVLLAGALEGG